MDREDRTRVPCRNGVFLEGGVAQGIGLLISNQSWAEYGLLKRLLLSEERNSMFFRENRDMGGCERNFF